MDRQGQRAQPARQVLEVQLEPQGRLDQQVLALVRRVQQDRLVQQDQVPVQRVQLAQLVLLVRQGQLEPQGQLDPQGQRALTAKLY